ncbi:fungal-specific transcription factor domain-containing protein [Dactylonectria macrodidyma]|uniref:Fungal-specific transcription factor domain-containing protein n=1 Tax=Dactylonectria macrodidyma TaxID=307937 RepID=A0A9P9INP0_9HYPO|nr:fungal-specific transcription factor domain-containing protein [Dactylonectria macrodidyma]
MAAWIFLGGRRQPESASTLAFTAIDGSTTPLLQLLLPLGLEWPPILHCLLSLSKQNLQRSESDFQHYQIALSELRSEIAALKTNLTDIAKIEKILASSFLLGMFTRPWCNEYWVQHARGMTTVLRLVDQSRLGASELGVFLISVCAIQDISAFSVGKRELSQHVWLSWMNHRSMPNSHQSFTALETVTGYPGSLVSLIAYVSEDAETNAFNDRQYSKSSSAMSDNMDSNFGTDSTSYDGSSTSSYEELETSLADWVYPELPPMASPVLSIALNTAWETMRFAVYIYLWRRCGFHSNLLKPFPAERASRKDLFVKKILSNIRTMVSMSQELGISVGNAMLWPLVVAAYQI